MQWSKKKSEKKLKIILNSMKRKTQPKFVGFSENSAWREFTASNAYVRKEDLKTDTLIFHLGN